MATEERYLGDDVLFEHAAMLLEGLCVLRAAQLDASPLLLCVVDAAAPGRVGGTRASYERWTQNVGAPEMIDLQQIHDQSEAGAAVSGDIAPPNARSKSDDTRPSTPSAPGPAVM